MFINLTARKTNGDFMITSSEVLRDMHPELSFTEISKMIIIIGDEYKAEGYQLDYTFDSEFV